MNGRVATFSSIVALTFAVLAASAPARARSCEDIASLKLPNTTIVSATEVPAGQFPVPKGPGADMQGPPPLEGTAPTKLPALCRVRITVAPAIKIEVWMPVSGWNGDFEGVGPLHGHLYLISFTMLIVYFGISIVRSPSFTIAWQESLD